LIHAPELTGRAFAAILVPRWNMALGAELDLVKCLTTRPGTSCEIFHKPSMLSSVDGIDTSSGVQLTNHRRGLKRSWAREQFFADGLQSVSTAAAVGAAGAVGAT
jgi:hypothetical protein